MVALAGCGGQPDDTGSVAEEPGSACGGSAQVTSTLGYDGELEVTCAASAAAKPAAADAGAAERVEKLTISAPIFPDVKVLYTGTGASYPATAQAQAKLAHEASVTFAELLAECPPLYPKIQLATGGAPLTPAQLADNYQAIEQCAYERHTAKPYWVPQLVEDVDICRAELGGGWRRLTGDDLAGLGVDAREAIAASLDFGGGSGGFYFSLRVFVLDDGGVARSGDLATDAVGAALAPFSDPREHLENPIHALRCIRRGAH